MVFIKPSVELAARGKIGTPSLVGHVGSECVGADMDSLVVEIERDAGRVAAAQRQAGRSFGLATVGVAEPDDLRTGQRIVAGGEVTK